MTIRRIEKTGMPWLLLLSLLGAVETPSVSAQARLEVRMFPSVVPGISRSHALAFTEPLLEDISSRLDIKIEFDLEDPERGKSIDDLRAFANKLNSGQYHIGVLWGLEYGWIQEQFQELDLDYLVIVKNGDQALWRSQLLVAATEIEKFEPLSEHQKLNRLKNRKLMWTKRQPLMDCVFLHKLLRDNGKVLVGKKAETPKPEEFFQVEACDTIVDAAVAVKEGNAYCMITSIVHFDRLLATQPTVANSLNSILVSDGYPPPLLVGNPGRINQLRPELWKRLREELRTMHRRPGGKEFISFWRMEAFEFPHDFQPQIRSAAKLFPVELLHESRCRQKE